MRTRYAHPCACAVYRSTYVLSRGDTHVMRTLLSRKSLTGNDRFHDYMPRHYKPLPADMGRGAAWSNAAWNLTNEKWIPFDGNGDAWALFRQGRQFEMTTHNPVEADLSPVVPSIGYGPEYKNWLSSPWNLLSGTLPTELTGCVSAPPYLLPHRPTCFRTALPALRPPHVLRTLCWSRRIKGVAVRLLAMAQARAAADTRALWHAPLRHPALDHGRPQVSPLPWPRLHAYLWHSPRGSDLDEWCAAAPARCHCSRPMHATATPV